MQQKDTQYSSNYILCIEWTLQWWWWWWWWWTIY